MFNYSKLRGKIMEYYPSCKAFAKELGISKVSLSHKMNNKVPFTQEEMLKAKQLLNLSNLDEYFFNTIC